MINMGLTHAGNACRDRRGCGCRAGVIGRVHGRIKSRPSRVITANNTACVIGGVAINATQQTVGVGTGGAGCRRRRIRKRATGYVRAV